MKAPGAHRIKKRSSCRWSWGDLTELYYNLCVIVFTPDLQTSWPTLVMLS